MCFSLCQLRHTLVHLHDSIFWGNNQHLCGQWAWYTVVQGDYVEEVPLEAFLFSLRKTKEIKKRNYAGGKNHSPHKSRKRRSELWHPITWNPAETMPRLIPCSLEEFQSEERCLDQPQAGACWPCHSCRPRSSLPLFFGQTPGKGSEGDHVSWDVLDKLLPLTEEVQRLISYHAAEYQYTQPVSYR